MASTSPATFGLLGLLAVRPWTGYELTRQVQRSLRFAWPTSEGHLYREQKRLVELGWASVEDEPAGRRTRKRYTITAAGRAALQEWQTTPPQEPQLHVEGILRAFFGDQAAPEVLAQSLRTTAEQAGEMLADLHGFVDDYLAEGGPLDMLERGVGGAKERLEHRGRPMFPERLHVVALALDVLTRVLGDVEQWSAAAACAVEKWPATSDASLTESTRARLEEVASRRADSVTGPRAAPGPCPPAPAPPSCGRPS